MLMQTFPQNLSCFKIWCTNACMQCSKMYCLSSLCQWLVKSQTKLYSTLLWQHAHYQYFPESTSSTSTKSSLQAENSTFFWRWQWQKCRSGFTKTRHCESEKKSVILCCPEQDYGSVFRLPVRIPARIAPLSGRGAAFRFPSLDNAQSV